MKCLTLKFFETSEVMYKYYSLIAIFLFGALSSIIFNRYWDHVTKDDGRPKHLIVRRPFSIVDFEDQRFFVTDQDAHELIIRETEVDVVCKFNLLVCRLSCSKVITIHCCSRSRQCRSANVINCCQGNEIRR